MKETVNLFIGGPYHGQRRAVLACIDRVIAPGGYYNQTIYGWIYHVH